MSTLSFSFATDEDDNFLSEIWPILLKLGFEFSNIFTRHLGLRGLDDAVLVRYSYDLRESESGVQIRSCYYGKFNDTNRHRG